MTSKSCRPFVVSSSSLNSCMISLRENSLEFGEHDREAKPSTVALESGEHDREAEPMI